MYRILDSAEGSRNACGSDRILLTPFLVQLHCELHNTIQQLSTISKAESMMNILQTGCSRHDLADDESNRDCLWVQDGDSFIPRYSRFGVDFGHENLRPALGLSDS